VSRGTAEEIAQDQHEHEGAGDLETTARFPSAAGYLGIDQDCVVRHKGEG
jgi:hypothetical protein